MTPPTSPAPSAGAAGARSRLAAGQSAAAVGAAAGAGQPGGGDPLAAQRTERALRCATTAARRLGLRPGEPRVLHDIFNVLVHLDPEPVVVRVPSLTLLSPEEQAARQRRELAVTGWLADTGAPVVRPSPLVPREPVACEDASLTFWEFVVETDRLSLADIAAADPRRLADRFTEQNGWAAELHRLLAGFPDAADLPVLAPLVPGIGRLLDRLRREPVLLTTADLDRAEREYAGLEALVAAPAASFPGVRLQALHGDSPGYNVLRTANGHLFSDFEDTTLGPVEWDLTMLDDAALESYENAAGLRLDRALLDVLDGARLLQAVSSLAVTSRMPQLRDMLAPAVEQWRARPPLTLPGT
ncbi:aminoglycoside phosphotransferase family protein [Streptomyces marincola]|uniref:Aminoglycoside phosphotransferase n=1 Tax=Streptomyces marincola TaxID=2878388 RepID=A0A1W7CX66_9ACTN|nr:aminoglycoside phosphotransferase family protein [Streptomyces marincola]ARQ68920.1 aminoglycoside phosphotransferase [Streptomyces marincola]